MPTRSSDLHLHQYLDAAARGDRVGIRALVRAWIAGEAVAGVLDARIRIAYAQACNRGWTARELDRILAKRPTPPIGVVDSLRAGPSFSLAERFLSAGIDHDRAVAWCVHAVRRLDLLGAPPAADFTDTSGRCSPTDDLDAGVLTKVRALLAKAESTEFPAEAEALSTKAHELLARHAIDDSVLVVAGRRPATVVSRRIGLDDPYANAKAALVHNVANANGCRAVWCRDAFLVVVVGRRADVEAVEVLYTSLLLQATNAMLAVASGEPGDHSRSRGFRTSFLRAFAHRIGARLQETAKVVADEAGVDLLPVLAARDRAVDDAFAAAFPRLGRRSSAGIPSGAGYTAGRAAAARADLGRGHLRPVPRGLPT